VISRRWTSTFIQPQNWWDQKTIIIGDWRFHGNTDFIVMVHVINAILQVISTHMHNQCALHIILSDVAAV